MIITNPGQKKIRFNFDKFTKQPTLSPDLDAGMTQSSVQRISAIQLHLEQNIPNTLNQPQKQLTDGRVVDVTNDEEAVHGASGEKLVENDEESSSGNDSSSGEETISKVSTQILNEVIDNGLAKKTTSYNPFDDAAMNDSIPTTGYNPFGDGAEVPQVNTSNSMVADSSSKKTSASNEELFRPKSGGFNWDRNWTSENGDLTPAKPTFMESVKNAMPTLTRLKVAIAAGSILTALAAGGATAAYFLYPVATAAFAATALESGSAVALGTYALALQPGVANLTFLAGVLTKVAFIPAMQFTATVLLPIISTAALSVLSAFIILYVANRVWEASKGAGYCAGSYVVNAFSNELDRTVPGQAIKLGVKTVASPYLALMQPNEEESNAMGSELVSSDEDSDSSESVSTNSQEAHVETTKRKKAQKKAQSSYGRKILNAGLMTVGLGLGGYLVYKMMPDINVFGK